MNRDEVLKLAEDVRRLGSDANKSHTGWAQRAYENVAIANADVLAAAFLCADPVVVAAGEALELALMLLPFHNYEDQHLREIYEANKSLSAGLAKQTAVAALAQLKCRAAAARIREFQKGAPLKS